MLYEATQDSFFEDMDGCADVLVLFFKDDCEPCHELMKVLKEYEDDVMMFNIDTDPDLAMEARVVHPSTLVLYKEMRPIGKQFAKGMDIEDINEWVAKRRKMYAT